jgi:hypothetical protein
MAGIMSPAGQVLYRGIAYSRAVQGLSGIRHQENLY